MILWIFPIRPEFSVVQKWMKTNEHWLCYIQCNDIKVEWCAYYWVFLFDIVILIERIVYSLLWCLIPSNAECLVWDISKSEWGFYPILRKNYPMAKFWLVNARTLKLIFFLLDSWGTLCVILSLDSFSFGVIPISLTFLNKLVLIA